MASLPRYAENAQPFTVLIEGNIGSGKTTFLNHFRKNDQVCLLTEPVEKWRNCSGVNLLDMMYKEPYRWAMPFQTYVTLTMLEQHTTYTDKPFKLMERSLFSSRYCFVENMCKNGSIHKGMYSILQEWYAFIDKTVNIRADMIVYLRTTPEVVFERMRKRAREEESCVPLKYLQELHELHENWLIHKRCGPDIPVSIVDANLGLDTIVSEYAKSEKQILKPKEALQPVTTSPIKRGRLSN